MNPVGHFIGPSVVSLTLLFLIIAYRQQGSALTLWMIYCLLASYLYRNWRGGQWLHLLSLAKCIFPGIACEPWSWTWPPAQYVKICELATGTASSQMVAYCSGLKANEFQLNWGSEIAWYKSSVWIGKKNTSSITLEPLKDYKPPGYTLYIKAQYVYAFVLTISKGIQEKFNFWRSLIVSVRKGLWCGY